MNINILEICDCLTPPVNLSIWPYYTFHQQEVQGKISGVNPTISDRKAHSDQGRLNLLRG